MNIAIASPFTPRETEIVQLLAYGKTALEISMIIGVTRGTVIDHIQNAKAKIDVYKDTALVGEAVRKGWVS